ncbi:MAG: HD domain-containing protein [Lachnospiraceae bacterium]|nr:HD domain-containing protein [Lachnospiraceae bacterium]
MEFSLIFLLISGAIIILDLTIAVEIFFHRENSYNKYLGLACVFAAMMQMTYLVSAFSSNYRIVSATTSVYLICSAFTLRFCVFFMANFTCLDMKKPEKYFNWLLELLVMADAVVLLINACGIEIAVTYFYIPGPGPDYDLRMYTLGNVHTGLVYFIALYLMSIVLRRMISIPKYYRKAYYLFTCSVVMLLVFNLVFLMFKNVRYDFSIWGYSGVTAGLYYVVFKWAKGSYISGIKNNIFDMLDHGLVMFDFQNRLTLCNEKARQQYPDVDFDNISFDEFLERGRINIDPQYRDVSFSFQCYNGNNKYKCDYRVMIGEQSEILGRIFDFSDESYSIDMLTEFTYLGAFLESVDRDSSFLPTPLTVTVFDISRLSEINKNSGRTAGDLLIKQLAGRIRTVFPPGTFFLRGEEADLIALSHNEKEEKIRERIEKVREGFSGSFQYAISRTDRAQNLMSAIDSAEKAINSKKLLDDKSRHSDSIKSLLQALEACDTDTEDHVVRTQRMGYELGRRIGLSDVQQSQLSLLCILHDIGKIAIPLEVLNKPGKLTDEEWTIMKYHVEKGYQIAMSSKELEGIADMIRHHHERWDGKGYPDGLAGEDIPLLSRIVSVVDSYDAMINDRVYRPALSARVAQEELKRCAGTQFDPNIVREYLAMLAEPDFARETEAQIQMVEARKRKQAEAEAASKVDVTAFANRVHSVDFSRYILDSKLNVITADDAFTEITGFTREDIKAGIVNQVGLVPEDDRDEYAAMVAQSQKKGMGFYVHDIKKKDGSVISVYCFGEEYFDSVSKEKRTEIVITPAKES